MGVGGAGAEAGEEEEEGTTRLHSRCASYRMSFARGANYILGFALHSIVYHSIA
jgi:hypothetical protein